MLLPIIRVNTEVLLCHRITHSLSAGEQWKSLTMQKDFTRQGIFKLTFFWCEIISKGLFFYNICYIKIDSESYGDYNDSDDMSQQGHSDSLQ